MINKQIVSWIESRLSFGFNGDEIRDILLSKGFKEGDIEAAISYMDAKLEAQRIFNFKRYIQDLGLINIAVWLAALIFLINSFQNLELFHILGGFAGSHAVLYFIDSHKRDNVVFLFINFFMAATVSFSLIFLLQLGIGPTMMYLIRGPFSLIYYLLNFIMMFLIYFAISIYLDTRTFGKADYAGLFNYKYMPFMLLNPLAKLKPSGSVFSHALVLSLIFSGLMYAGLLYAQPDLDITEITVKLQDELYSMAQADLALAYDSSIPYISERISEYHDEKNEINEILIQMDISKPSIKTTSELILLAVRNQYLLKDIKDDVTLANDEVMEITKASEGTLPFYDATKTLESHVYLLSADIAKLKPSLVSEARELPLKIPNALSLHHLQMEMNITTTAKKLAIEMKSASNDAKDIFMTARNLMDEIEKLQVRYSHYRRLDSLLGAINTKEGLSDKSVRLRVVRDRIRNFIAFECRSCPKSEGSEKLCITLKNMDKKQDCELAFSI